MRKLFYAAFLITMFSQVMFAGRYYDARTGRFLQIDPKAHKYPNHSPYAYCADNPLKYIDPDGKEIRFAPGSSTAFQKQFGAAVKYLNVHNASGLMKELQNSKTVFYINESSKNNFDHKTNYINWDPTKGVMTNNGTVLSATTILNHEVDHALQHDKNLDQYRKDNNTKDAQYDNKEEKRVITGSEQETARALGEITGGEVTREDHGGTLTSTMSPTSTELDPTKSSYKVTITAEEERKK